MNKLYDNNFALIGKSHFSTLKGDKVRGVYDFVEQHDLVVHHRSLGLIVIATTMQCDEERRHLLRVHTRFSRAAIKDHNIPGCTQAYVPYGWVETYFKRDRHTTDSSAWILDPPEEDWIEETIFECFQMVKPFLARVQPRMYREAFCPFPQAFDVDPTCQWDGYHKRFYIRQKNECLF